MNPEEIENLCPTIMSKETESVIKNLPTKKSRGPGVNIQNTQGTCTTQIHESPV